MKRERTPAQRGRMSRNKGSSYERDVANTFKEHGYPHAKRGLTQTRVGEEVPDVINVCEYWIETKAHHRVNIRKAFEQARDASAASPNDDYRGLIPLVISKDDGKEQLATMSFSRLLYLLKRIAELQDTCALQESRIDAFLDGDNE